MSIQEHLNKIRNAVYGHEVRESIAKGIETAYDDASEKDNANMEVKIARGTHPTLRDRLNEVDNTQQQTTAQLQQTEQELSSQLAQKANQAETRLTTQPIGVNDIDGELLGYLQDGVGGNTIEVLSIPRKASVSPDKTTFFENIGKNLFDKENVTLGKYVEYSTGALVTMATFGVSDYIPITPNIYYSKRNIQQMAFYDGNKNFIGGIDGQGTFQTPSNARYARINFLLSEIDKMQFEKGESITLYEPYQSKFPTRYLADSNKFVKKVLGKNLFDKSTVQKDYYISFTNGKPSFIEGYYASDYIEIEPSTTYTKSITNQFAFYDENKQFISGVTDGTKTFTTPENARYVRLTATTANIDTLQLEKGSQQTTYEPYGYVLPNLSSDMTKGIVTVGTNKGDYNSIQEAYDQTNGDVVIRVLQGTYLESLKFQNPARKVSLLGVDRDNCIVQDNSGDYHKAPLDASPNIFVENMTFISTHTDGTPYDIPAYAVHLDSLGAGTAHFKNCKMVSYQNSGVGIGTHRDQTIILDGCEIVKLSSRDGGALYLHNAQASNVTNQKLIVKNCIIKTNVGFAIKVDDANTYSGGTNSPMDIAFYFNVVHSDTMSKDQRVWYRDAPINGGVSGQIKLVSDSFGNNDIRLNA